MNGARKTGRLLRFSVFELDLDAGELFKQGRKVKLQAQPLELLSALLERPGEVVTREELRQKVWPSDTVVDFDQGLNRAINKLREALDDSAETPQLIETLPRRGYRFIGSIHQNPNLERPSKPSATQQVAGRSHLPVSRTPLIGRERELAAVQQLLLDPAIRLVTLTGSGGSGKTRLGLEVAGALVELFQGRVHFIALGSISDPAMVPAAIAQAVGLPESLGRGFMDLLKHFLQEFGPSPVLLLLDNLEHILPASSVVVELLEASPALKVLVTSRAALRVYGEYEFPVPPLELPDVRQLDSLDALAGNPAVALFAQRAAAVKSDFKLTAENGGAVAEICSRVDGLPLAIELAAARVKMLSVNAMLPRLESRLQLLTAGPRDLPERQQTLRKTLDWSYDLLNQAEQKLFRRLGVFCGGCTLEAAEAVCNTCSDLGDESFDLMSSLVDKSLIQQIVQGAEEPRFQMLETIREYSLQLLRDSGEETATKRNHAAYSLVLAEEGNPELDEAARVAWLARCDLEHDNFRAALDWLFQSSDLDWGFRLCLALFRFWDMREHLMEARARLEALLQLTGAGFLKERAKALHFLGAAATALGDFPAAVYFLEQSLSLYRELGDQPGIAVSLNALAVSARDCGDYLTAQNKFEESLAYWRQVGDRVAIARCLHNVGNLAKLRGNYTCARSALLEAMQIFEELGDRSGAAWSLNQQGDLALEEGDLAEARKLYQRALSAFQKAGDGRGCARSLADLGSIACEEGDHSAAHAGYRESLEISSSLGHRRGIARVLEGLACLALAKGDARHALSVAAAAAHLRKLISAPLTPQDQLKLDQRLQPAWESLSEPDGKSAWEAGSAMALESAVEYSAHNPESAT
jgi:predicted ATPase/DNA-binding winged helix-turn-helix (wHTH) protein